MMDLEIDLTIFKKWYSGNRTGMIRVAVLLMGVWIGVGQISAHEESLIGSNFGIGEFRNERGTHDQLFNYLAMPYGLGPNLYYILNGKKIAPPPNDDLCNATALDFGISCGGFSYTTIDASLEGGEPVGCIGDIFPTVWFSFIAPPSGYAYIQTTRENQFAKLDRSVYRELVGFNCSDFSTIEEVECNDDFGTDDFLEVCGLMPGDVYYLRVYSFGAGENFCVDIHTDDLAVAGPDQNLCNQTTSSLAGNTPAIGSGLWSVVNGTANITDPNLPASGVTGLIPGTSCTLQWTITFGACTPSTSQMMITVSELPTTAFAGDDQQLCNAFNTVSEANDPVFGTGMWTVISGPGVVDLPTQGVAEVNDLIPGMNTVLRWTISNAPCVSSVDDVTIFNAEDPTPADAGPSQVLCDQSTTGLAGNVPVIGTGMWSVVSGSVNITNPASPTSGVTGLVAGTTVTLQWTITNGACPASSSQMTITVSELPTTAFAGDDQQLCNAFNTVSEGNDPVVGTGMWTVLSGPGVVEPPTQGVAEVNDLIPGMNTVLRWTISNAPCVSSVDDVTIFNAEDPTPAEAGPSQLLCDQTSTVLAGNVPVIGTGMWSVVSGSANITDPASPTSGVTGLVAGTTATLQWTIANGACPASTSQMTITVYELPSVPFAGMDQVLCNQTMTVVSADIPLIGSGIWSVLNGVATIDPANQPMAEVSGLVVGASATMQWTITNGVCPTVSDQIVITVDPEPTTSDAGPEQSLCDVFCTNLEGNMPSVGTGMWVVISGPGTVSDPFSPTSEFCGLDPGIPSVIEWVISYGVCPSSTSQVTLEVALPPGQAYAGDDQTLCGLTSTTLEGNAPVNGQGEWTVVQGIAIIVDPANPETEVTGLIAGETVILRWTISNGACPESFDQVTIQVDGSPGTPFAGDDQNLCNQTSTIVEADPPLFGSGIWTVVIGTASVIPTNQPNAEVLDLIPGTTVILQWTVSNGNCMPASDQMSITVDLEPSAAVAGPDQVLCNQTTAVMSGNAPSVGVGSWTVISGTCNIANPSDPKTEITGLSPSTVTTLRWTISNGACVPSTSEVSIQVDALPSGSEAGQDQFLCELTTSDLEGNTPLTGTGAWSLASGIATITDPSSPSSPVSDLLFGSVATLVWTISNGSCPDSRDTMIIRTDQLPSNSNAGMDQVLCDQSVFVLEGNVPSNGEGLWTIVSGSGNITDPSAANSSLTGLISGSTVTLQWTISNPGCPASSSQVIIQIDEPPTQAVVGEDLLLCEEFEAILDANIPMTGTGSWTVISGSGNISDVNDAQADVTGLIFGSPLVLAWVTSNGVCATADTIVITTYESPANAEAGESMALCLTETMLEADQPVVGSGMWTVISGSANIADPSSPVSSVTGMIPGSTVVLEWTVTNGPCPASSDQVTFMIDPDSPIAIAGDKQEICNLTTTTLNAVPANVGGGEWTIVKGAGIIDDPAFEGTSISGLVPGDTIRVRWTVTGITCPPAFDEVEIINYRLPDMASAGLDIEVCDPTAFLMADLPMIGTGSWSIINGTGNITDPNDPFSGISDLLEGEIVQLEWTVANGVCPPGRDTVVIVRDHYPSIPNAGDDVLSCDLQSLMLDANTPDPGKGSGQWSVESGTGMFSDPSDPNTVVSMLSLGLNEYVWEITSGVCLPLRDTVAVTNLDGEVISANLLVSESACAGDTIHFFDISENTVEPTAFLWDFGDNTTSTERDPVHQYDQPGEYAVSLTTFLGDCPGTTVVKTISIYSCLVDGGEARGNRQILYANVFPNPTIDDFHVFLKLRKENNVEISVFTVDGKLQERRSLLADDIVDSLFSVEETGMYFVKIRVNDEVLNFKVLKLN